MTKAIFLSYASQDADAARRICESLRAAADLRWALMLKKMRLQD